LILFILALLNKTDIRIEGKVDDLVKIISAIQPKVDFVWEKAMAGKKSPKVLNEEGERIFNQSGSNRSSLRANMW